MKNQRSIVELLVDMLRKQDRHEELLRAMVESQSKIVDVQSKMAEAQLQTNERLDGLNDRFDRLINVLSNNWFKRIITLEDEMEAVKRKLG